jgi:hypothetical protein
MDPIEVYADFYSPRWGHDDRYRFVFSMDRLEIVHAARKCAAIWHEKTDPTWEGTPLTGTFINDMIRPPHDVEGSFTHLWSEWRNGTFTPEQLQTELTAFAEYMNASTRAKPTTDFWQGMF